MAYITRQEKQQTGKWWNWILVGQYDTVIRETDAPMSEAEAVAIRDAHIEQNTDNSIQQEIISVYDHRDVLKDAIAFIKQKTPTLAQWNTYLGTLSWYDAALVRYFLATLAWKLASRNDITLTTRTEADVLQKLKAWIVNTPAKRIAKVVFGEAWQPEAETVASAPAGDAPIRMASAVEIAPEVDKKPESVVDKVRSFARWLAG